MAGAGKRGRLWKATPSTPLLPELIVAAICRPGGFSMLTLVRAGLLAALLSLACGGAMAADKAFHRTDLDDAAVRLEAQIKTDAGAVTKPVAALRQDADA